MKKTATCILLFTIALWASVQAQNRQYLQKAYNAAGGAAALVNLDAWKLQEKQTILKSIHELPEDVKSELTASADKLLKQEWAMPKLSDYSEFKLNGNRVNFESMYFNRRTRLSVLCAAELATRKGKYLPEIANGLWMILEESSWALPAHMYSDDSEGPDPEKPLIDLFAGETAAHLALIKFLLQDEISKFSPVVMKRLDFEIRKRVTEPYLATDDYWWMGLKTKRKQNNWNIWINTNVMKTALLAENDVAKRTAVIEKTMRCADRFLDTYPDDGGCDEGPAYWSAAGGCLGEFVNTLTRASSGKLSWKSNALIHNIGTYIYKVHIDSTRFVNFADAPASTIPDPGRVYNFAELFNDQQTGKFASYLAKVSGSPMRWLGVSSIIVFASTVRVSKQLLNSELKAPFPKQSWLPDLQVINLREMEGSSKGLSFMAKAGNNNESHNHNDIGNFMLYLDGSPVTIDPGKGTYSRQTFSKDRYKLWYTQSQWHNCPSVNGIDQQAGSAFKASNVNYKPGDKKEVFSMDLAQAYPEKAGIKSWLRKFTYERSAGELTLQESYVLNEYVAPAKIHFIACRKPVQLHHGLIRLESFTGKGFVIMSFDPGKVRFTIEEQPVDDKALEAVWGKYVYRVSLQPITKSLKNNYTVTFTAQKP